MRTVPSISHAPFRRSRAIFATALLALALALLAGALVFATQLIVVPHQAYAQTYTGTAILNNETEIERTTNDYLTVKGEYDEVCARIAELEAKIPAAQERCNKAVVALYKGQGDWLALVNALFESETLGDYLRQSDRIEIISRKNLAAINELRALKQEADDLREQVQPRYDAAHADLVALQDERRTRQSSGIWKSSNQALSLGGENSVGVAYDGGEQPEDYREAASTDTYSLDDGADWYSDRDEFIDHWAARIDAYLAGSALEGQGANFAQAAWKYNVDPRWSPAISNTESSKGAVCIRPYNAWGWGADDRDPYGLALEWGSWEEAIDAHVRGLSEGYGYTISILGARAYCPNTWQSWYNKTLAEMSMI